MGSLRREFASETQIPSKARDFVRRRRESFVRLVTFNPDT